MPTKPPPLRIYRSNASCWSVLSTSPVVLRKITALNCCRFSRLNKLASSVASTMKPFSLPNCSIATIPAGMELCRNPSVFENTNTLNDCEYSDVPKMVISKKKLAKYFSNFVFDIDEYKLVRG